MIGGDVLISDMRMKHSHSTASTLLYYRVDQSGSNVNYPFKNHNVDSNAHKKSFFRILNILIKVSVATDPFLIGNIFKCGYLWNAILFVFFCVLTEFSFFILIQSWIYGRAYSYNEIWHELFGNKSPSWIILVVVIINYATLIIWNQNELSQYVEQTITIFWSDTPSILTNKWFLTYLLSAIFFLPPLFVKKLSNFSVISMIGNFFLIVAFVCLIFYFFHSLIKFDVSFATVAEVQGLKSFKSNVFDIFHTIQTINIAIFCHPVLSVLVQDFDNPTRSRLMKLTWVSTAFSLVIHFFAGFFSYLINPENEGNIFYEMEIYNSDGSKIIFPEVIIGQISVYIVSILTNIIYIHFISRKIAEFILPKAAESIVSVFFCGLTAILFTSAMNFIGDEVFDIFDLIGGVTSMMLTYVFPSVYYFYQYRFSNKVFGIVSVCLIIIGIGLSIALLVLGILEY